MRRGKFGSRDTSFGMMITTGLADVGSTIRSIGANKFHQPWRSTAWEIHPIVKIEALDDVPAAPAQGNSRTPSPTAEPSSTGPRVAPIAPVQQFATLTKEVKIKIPYGETIIPRGTKLLVVKRDGSTVIVQYLDHPQIIPIASTDLK